MDIEGGNAGFDMRCNEVILRCAVKSYFENHFEIADRAKRITMQTNLQLIDLNLKNILAGLC